MNHPANIYNVDGIGLPLNNKSGYVPAVTRIFHKITFGEKGENITTIVQCSAGGNFLFSSCAPSGSLRNGLIGKATIPPYTNKQGPTWATLKRHSYGKRYFFLLAEKSFNSSKSTRNLSFVAHGHTSQTHTDALLDLAGQKYIVFICLPSYCSHYL